MSFNGHEIPWWFVVTVAVSLIVILIVAIYA